MENNFKDIHIGKIIELKFIERNIDMARACDFLHCEEQEINIFFSKLTLDSEWILKWSKLLAYDLFRIYSQHLILYSPPHKNNLNNKKIKSNLPEFRKNIYTKELIELILDTLNTCKKTKLQIIEDYQIPKTTLYKWIKKHQYEKS